uniref:Uncharacterized protein n=1 Tax=Rhizophora mucronata TaxID=61149 RepID=A0A2P2QKU4_RHIMU
MTLCFQCMPETNML